MTLTPQLSRLVATTVVCMGVSHASMAQNNSEADVFSHSVIIKREAADVWAALVTKELVDTYYFVPISADIAEAGQDFHYGPGDQVMIAGKVLELAPPEVFKHSFRFAGNGQPGSTVTYILKAQDEATRVTVEHEGYGRDTQPYADIAEGWPIVLGGLKAKLEAN